MGSDMRDIGLKHRLACAQIEGRGVASISRTRPADAGRENQRFRSIAGVPPSTSPSDHPEAIFIFRQKFIEA